MLRLSRVVLALLMVAAGVLHLLRPQGFIRVMPAYLPAAATLVMISGVAELLGGIGLLLSPTRRWAAWGLVALYVAVWPANLNMALNNLGFGEETGQPWLLWARLPLQGVLIGWAYRLTRG